MALHAPSLDFAVPTRYPPYQATLRRLEGYADRGAREIVIIRGGDGVGKLSLARRYYQRLRHHGFAQGPLVEVLCMGDDTTDIEAFARLVAAPAAPNAAGAATGSDRPAVDGMVIIHRVDRLGSGAQEALLQVLERHDAPPPEGAASENGASRVIWTYHPALPRGFHATLSRRLEVHRFDVPSLGERRVDIEANLDHLLQQFGVN